GPTSIRAVRRPVRASSISPSAWSKTFVNEERSAIVPRASRPGSRSRPYRSFFVWHVGNEDVVGDANPALFITGGEEYRMSHPVRGGYAELIFTPAECIVSELADATRGGLRPRVVPAAQPLFGPAPAVLSGAFSLLGKWIEG